jgi:hypothetical protein
MAKKREHEEVVNETVSTSDADDSGLSVSDGGEEFFPETSMADMADFNVEDEYKAMPLIPKGTYYAHVTKVAYNNEDLTIDWTVTFSDNEGIMMLDDETPLDGNTLGFRNFLPKPGDELERTKSGRMTKRQAKINMLGDFAKGMGIEMKTPPQILNALANQEWLGLPCKVTVGFRTWDNRTFNNAEKMVAA